MRQQNRRAPGLRKMTSVVAGLGAVLFIAGCSAGQITQTDSQNAAINGATANVGSIAIRDAEMVLPEGEAKGEAKSCHATYHYPAGANAPLDLFIVNGGGVDDELVSVTSQVADSVAVQGDTGVVAHSGLVVGEHARADAGEKLNDPEEAAATSTTASAPNGDSANTQGSQESSSAPAAQSSAAPGIDEAGHAKIVLEQLAREIRPGQSVEVTFTFKNAGAITVDIPTDAPIAPRVAQGHNESECGH